MNGTEHAAEVRGVTKRYFDGRRKVFALRDVTLKVRTGELCVLLGPSGSGKTTLLHVLGGLTPPTSGEVWVGGKSISHMRDHHRVTHCRDHIGFVFQHLALIGDMSVTDNLLLPLVPTGGATSAERDKATALLKQFGVSELADSTASRLSGGEKQRVAMARALIRGPETLLLDEPTAHLDTENVRTIVDLMVARRDAGCAIIASTHDPRLAEDARVDRVLQMQDGALLP